MKKRNSGQNALFRATEIFDLPGDIIAGVSRVEIVGGRDMRIENHSGILEYGESAIDINTENAVLRIRGSSLEIISMTTTEISIRGNIFGFEYVY